MSPKYLKGPYGRCSINICESIKYDLPLHGFTWLPHKLIRKKKGKQYLLVKTIRNIFLKYRLLMKYKVHMICGTDTEPRLLLCYAYHHFMFLMGQLGKRRNPFPRLVNIICGTCYNIIIQTIETEKLLRWWGMDSQLMEMLSSAFLVAKTSSTQNKLKWFYKHAPFTERI